VETTAGESHPGSYHLDAVAAAAREAIWAAGGQVAGETGRGAEALGLVQRCAPDVVVCAVGLGEADGVAVAAEITGTAGRPVVLLTSHTDPALVERARLAGVMAYLLKPLRQAELAPALDLAVARFAEARALERRLEERKVIERAKGLLMRRYGLGEEEAFQRLRRAAMDSRTPMVDIARALLVSDSVARGESGPPAVSTRGR